MRYSRQLSAIVLLLALLAGATRADVIAVINGVEVARTAGGGDLTIDVGEIGSDTTVRIFDEDSSSTVAPTLSVGKITIEGAVEDESDAKLSILVSPGFTFPLFGLIQLSPSVVNFGNSGGGLVFTDDGLRDASTLALACTGDVNGSIDVGRIRRIQAFGRGSPLVGGSINANITTHAPDLYDSTGLPPPTLDSRSIDTIHIARSITGNITALGIDPTPNDPNSGDEQPAGIQRIWVGPTELEDGIISGHIRAELGTIGVIYTTAPIGTPTSPVSIVAGNGIYQVRAVKPGVFDGSGNAQVFIKDFHVDIVAHKQMLDSRETFVFRYPECDGVLSILETAGDITGEIRAANVTCMGVCQELPEADGAPPGDFQCFKPGIYCRGTVAAPITIDYNLLTANIIAHAFTAPIDIGRFAKGAIVATGAEGVDGEMVSIIIGRGDLPPLEPDVTSSPYWQYASLGPGLCGVEGFDEDHPPVLVSAADWFNAEQVDFGAIDSVIRATHSIGTVDVASLSVILNNMYDAPFPCKTYAPRVEAPVIGSLTIDDIRDGSVWSGIFGDPGNEFALIDHVTLGCLGPSYSFEHEFGRVRAAVWMKDWTTAIVTGNVFGVIHVPTVPSGRSIIIGGRLANWLDPLFQLEGDLVDEACRCRAWPDAFGCYYESTTCRSRTEEDTPRDPHFPLDGSAVAAGRIMIHEPSSLVGQIVINADAEALGADPAGPTEAIPFWSGVVEVDTSIGLVTMSADEDLAVSPNNLAPAYRQVSNFLGIPDGMGVGGGAVGLVPYQFYACDSMPSLKSQASGPVDPVGFGNGDIPIKIRLYGPITASSAAASVLVRKVGSGSTSFNSNFVISFQSINGFQREIRLMPLSTGGDYELGDQYIVTPVLEGENSLRCNLLAPGTSNPVVSDFTFAFEFAGPPIDCPADFNQDTFVDPDDLADFITCFFLDIQFPSFCPAADFNGDSSRDPDDLADFITTFFLTVQFGCP